MINAWDTDYRDPDELAAPWLVDRPEPLDDVERALVWLDYAYRTRPGLGDLGARDWATLAATARRAWRALAGRLGVGA